MSIADFKEHKNKKKEDTVLAKLRSEVQKRFITAERLRIEITDAKALFLDLNRRYEIARTAYFDYIIKTRKYLPITDLKTHLNPDQYGDVYTDLESFQLVYKIRSETKLLVTAVFPFQTFKIEYHLGQLLFIDMTTTQHIEEYQMEGYFDPVFRE